MAEKKSKLEVKLYDFNGKELGNETLEPKLFGVEINPQLVQEVVVAQRKNARQVLAHTKGRSEVRGGGKKPWQQKGTGRARHGSIRSPLWVGGGITFGPTKDRNFAIKVNKKAKQKALAMVLTDKFQNDRFILVDAYNLPEAKTKFLKSSLEKLPIKNKKTLVVTKDAKDNVVLAAKNLSKVNTISYGSLNVVDLLSSEYLLVSRDLLKKISEHYL
jgi:large subunit ribosomal protein L4